MSYGLGITVIGPVLESVQETFDTSAGRIGLLFPAQSVGFIGAVILAGSLVDRGRARAVGLLGQGLLSMGLVFFAFAPSLPSALGAFGLIGVGGGFIQIATNATVAAISTRRASSLNLLHLFVGLGALLGPLCSSLLLRTGAGWGAPFLVLAGYSACVFVMLLMARYPKT